LTVRLGGLRVFLTLWLLAVAGGQAWAHQEAPSSGDPSADVRWLLILILPAALALRIRRPRPWMALSLVVLTATFAVEGARHSAHHAPGAVSACTVGAAAAHVPVTDGDARIQAEPVLVAVGRPREPVAPIVVGRASDTRRGRAPPAPLA
jgi:hypothetical protein